MFPALLCFVLLLFTLQVEATIVLTEVMYDPEGSDNNKEYVELYTGGVSLENYTLEDLASTDTLQLRAAANSSYALIVEDEFNYSGINATIYTVGKTIGNGLNNQKDLILVRDTSGNIVDVLLYTSKLGGSGNNKSLCKQQDTLYECLPTPGEKDIGQQVGNESVEYALSINEFLPDPEGNDRDPLPKGEWVELYNAGNTTIDLRGLALQDKGNHTIILSDVNFAATSLIAPEAYHVVYLNGKILLNNNGYEELRILLAGEVLDSVSYDGSREEVSWSRHPDGYFVLAAPTKGEENNLAGEALQTNISIETIHMGRDNKVKFGEQLRIRLKVYKGDVTKNQIKVYLKDLTKQTSFNVYTKFQSYIFTVPLQLTPNCKGKYDDGSYDLVVDGLDVTVVEPVNVSGINQQLCIKIKENTTQKTKKLSLKTAGNEQNEVVSDTFINQPGVLVYESNDAKARRYALYFFCLVLICIVGAYVFHLEA